MSTEKGGPSLKEKLDELKESSNNIGEIRVLKDKTEQIKGARKNNQDGN